MNNKFIILVTQRDAAPFIKRCLDSIVSQTYKNYEVIIMDDNSTDGTWEIIQKYPFQAIHTPKQNYHIKNFIAGINAYATNKEDIICFVSGDDYLFSDDVLAYLNKVYQKDIWLTYGSYNTTSNGKKGICCAPVVDTRIYRKSGAWHTSHLVTCKKKLWDKIDNKDLRYKNGEYPNNSFDNAMMYPMVEMAGLKHIQYIEKILYAYNDQNPIAAIHFKEDPKACMREREYWIKKDSYQELIEL
jgi:glycosyltransferase involved in cell wall biosynthesis